jgi:glycosyltransferase involved in cell wall biosynthesis
MELPSDEAERSGSMKISIVTPCFNEAENVAALYNEVKTAIGSLGPQYHYEHIFIDNASTDETVAILKRIAAEDKRVKIIVNAKNFGVYRSPLHALYQASGEVIIPMSADLQDPPDLIPEFVRLWEQGYKIVAAVKKGSQESFPMALVRKAYYRILCYLAETELIKDFTGFGLYDKCVVDLLRSTGDHYPYVRGLLTEMGYPIARVEYIRPTRKRGFTKNRLIDLYAQAMNGIVNHSKMPLRLATLMGMTVALLSFAVSVGYFVYKIRYWYSFSIGMAPLVLGLFFFSSVQLIFLGVLGEYIGAIHSRVFQKWLVIEKERVNFD